MVTTKVRDPQSAAPTLGVAMHSGHESPTADSVVDDRALLAALREGEEWAFETMIRLYGGRLLAVAKRFTKNDHDAQDVVQSAYLSAFRALGTFEGTCQLSTWLHRIVVNSALMKLRSRRRKPEESIEQLLPAFQLDGHHVEQFSDWSVPADQLIERKETQATVRACIDQLPENYRAVLILRDIQELSTQEAAEALSMTTTAVKVRLHRARQALSTLLRRQYAKPAQRQSQAPTRAVDSGARSWRG
jgi:RNA polymerase sigma-70 factor, ECF subfamily